MRLNQVTVGSTDPGRSGDFYLALGFRLIVRDDDYLRFECPEGDATFSVERVVSVPPDEQVTLYFETTDLAETCRTLAAGGITFDREPEEMPWLWKEARLRDPDGHRLCLFEAGNNRRFPPWRLPADDRRP